MIAAASQQRFIDLYRRLLVASIRNDLPQHFVVGHGFSAKELQFLLSMASRLALSDEPGHQRQAYDIATLVPAFKGDNLPAWADTTELLLARLGNFPGRRLAQKRFRNESDGRSGKIPTYLALESDVREDENTIFLEGEQKLVLTDFQARLLDALSRRHTVSVSAPTSAGKSFVLALYVLRRLQAKEPLSLVYVVPTRALIRQVMMDILRHLKEAGLGRVSVICVPQPPTERQVQDGIIYVLTQERLTALLHSDEGKPFINTLIVDEAHEIANDRGVILQSAIDEVLRRFPEATLFFSAPLSANPEYFLTLFNRADGGEGFVEQVAPVSQNLLMVSEVDRKPKQATIELLVGDDAVPVGTVDLDFSMRTARRAAHLARSFTGHRDTSIVFANTPATAEENAAEIADALPTPAELDPDIKDLIEFLETHVHRKYLLIEYLKKGVAFHYGKMPILVRTRIEDLLRSRKIRFVACTTTLLQGVNLPAKNIFIDRPKKGKQTPMGQADFWNLAGRAGRMSEEFHGNVWCICREEWAEDPLKGERLQRLGSSLAKILTERVDELIRVIRDRKLKEKHDPRVEEAFGNIFANYTLVGRRLVDSPLVTPENRANLVRVDQECDAARVHIKLPVDVFQRNTSISPWRLEALRSYFAGQLYPDNLIILSVVSKDAYRRIERVYQVLDQFFFLRTNSSYIYYTQLTYRWVKGESLKDIIANHLQFYKIANDAQIITKEIRKLLDDLEDELRFEYVKYLRAYSDVLHAFLVALKRQDLAKKSVPLHQFIEYGAAEIALISLMGLGVSRMTAILLQRALRLPSDTTREGWSERLNKLNLDLLDIPRICKLELENVRRK